MDHTDHIPLIFENAFTASEGPAEGAMIRALAMELLALAPSDDIRVFIASEDADIAAAVFTRLTYSEDPRMVFLLSPMAVLPEYQSRGVGQGLLRYALDSLRRSGVDIAVTYGDPKFYQKVQFHPVSETTVPAPMPLSMPEGWIAQSLTDAPLSPLRGTATCVPPLNRPEIW